MDTAMLRGTVLHARKVAQQSMHAISIHAISTYNNFYSKIKLANILIKTHKFMLERKCVVRKIELKYQIPSLIIFMKFNFTDGNSTVYVSILECTRSKALSYTFWCPFYILLN